MPSGYKRSLPCPKCEVETSPNQAGLYHCLTDGCPVAHFRADFHGTISSIVYCADVEEERV